MHLSRVPEGANPCGTASAPSEVHCVMGERETDQRAQVKPRALIAPSSCPARFAACFFRSGENFTYYLYILLMK